MQFFQKNQFHKATSSLSNRDILVNESLNQFYVAPAFSVENALECLQLFIANIQNKPKREQPTLKSYQPILDVINSPTEDLTAELILTKLNEHLVYLSELIEKGTAKPAKLLLQSGLYVLMWEKSLIAFPAKASGLFEVISLKVEFNTFSAETLSLLNKLRPYIAAAGGSVLQNMRYILDYMLARIKIIDILDITPATFYQTREASRRDFLRSTPMKGILALLREEAYEQTISWTPESFGFFQEKMGRLAKDDEYAWALEKEESLEEWLKHVKKHLEKYPTNYKKRKSTMNNFVQYLLDNPGVTRNPLEFFNVRNVPNPMISLEGQSERQGSQILSQFFETVLSEVATLEDDAGYPVVMPGYANPFIKKIFRNVNKGETHREAMPTRLIKLAMDILSANNFEWAKKVAGHKDIFAWKNPTTGIVEQVWSPVRAYALLLKMLLPARTHQIRFLDSGEGDTLRFSNGKWIPNTGPHAPGPLNKRKSVENGVFRKYTRRDGSTGTVFYFNTNKTADIDSDSKGYVMPWEKQDAIEILEKLRDWQEKYNPVQLPTNWTDIIELKKVKHQEHLEKMGSNFFLFRDPGSHTRPDLPVTDVRLRGLWLRLMDEMEKRLETTGETLANGAPVKLIVSRDASGMPSAAVFDLHTLRVSIITALYEEGVPPEFLMKIVGHASVLMTLYYTKINAETMSLRMNEALKERQRKAQDEFLGFVGRASLTQLEKATAYRFPAAIDALKSATGAGIVVMDHGICAGGARRCSEGLQVLEAASGVNRYQAVPGGASNCTRCRFFITGPAFLFGLEAHVNNLAYQLKIVSEKFEKAQTKFDALSDEHADCLDAKEPFFKGRELESAEVAYEASMAEVDNIALSLQSAYQLTEQAIAIAHKQYETDATPQLALVPA